MLQDREWAEVGKAIRKAANIHTDAWDDESDFMRKFRMTRHTLNPEWRQYNISQSELQRIPHPGVIHDELRSMFEELFQPIIDLDWENYFWPEPESDFDWRYNLFRHDIISVNEYRELMAIPEGIIDAARTRGAPTESEGSTSTG